MKTNKYCVNSTNSSGETLALNKDKSLLENLQPISLLNVDYKILTKSIAKRLEQVLPKIINSDQTGYIKGRFIGENVRLLQDVMFQNRRKNSVLPYFLTFEKRLIQ